MQDILNNLISLQGSLPISWTIYNTQLLKIKFLEYKTLIAFLPENYQALKTHCETFFEVIKSRIDLIERSDTPARKASNMFQEAVDQIKSQIDMIVSTVEQTPGLA